MNTSHKYQEIKGHALDYIKDNDINLEDYTEDTTELHHQIFNTDYYIIGYYKAEKWCKNQTFNIIETIKEYEQDNFGEVTTDLSNSENVVNMYTYIVGEDAIYEIMEDTFYSPIDWNIKRLKLDKATLTLI